MYMLRLIMLTPMDKFWALTARVPRSLDIYADDVDFLIVKNALSELRAYVNKKRLHDYFFGVFESFEMFCKVLDATTQDNSCLVASAASTYSPPSPPPNPHPPRGICQ